MTRRKPRCQCCGLYQKEFLVTDWTGRTTCHNCRWAEVRQEICPHQVKRMARALKDKPDPNQMDFFDNPDMVRSTEGWTTETREVEVTENGWALISLSPPTITGQKVWGVGEVPPGKILIGTATFHKDGTSTVESRVETDEEQAARLEQETPRSGFYGHEPGDEVDTLLDDEPPF